MQDKDTLCDANHFIKGLQPLNSIVVLTRHGVVLLHPLNGTNSGSRDVQGPQASSFGKITRRHTYTLRVSQTSLGPRPRSSVCGLRLIYEVDASVSDQLRTSKSIDWK